MKEPSRPTITFIDGSTFRNELPQWMIPSTGGIKKNVAPEAKAIRTLEIKLNVYYESLKPIFAVLTVMGILPVYRLRIGNHMVQALLGGGICLTMYVVFAYFTYLVTLDILHLIFNDDDFSSVIIQVTLMMLLTQHVFYLLLTWPESIAVNKYIIQWKEFQKQYKLVTGRNLQLNCRRKVSFFLLISAVLSMLYPYFIDRIDDKSIKGKTGYVVLSYHIFIQLCFYNLWFSNSLAITHAARQYYEHLAEECAADISAEKLEDYRLVWMRLTLLVRAGSSMLSYTMAFMVTTPFAYEVIAAYNLTMHVIRRVQSGKNEDSDEAIAIGLTFIFYSSLLYMFCNAGHSMTTECEKIQDVLLTHKPRSPEALAKVNSGLRLFLRCLRSVPPLATLSGYVTINRKVFLHLTGVLVTYLIILVQFNISSIHNDAGKKATTEKSKN